MAARLDGARRAALGDAETDNVDTPGRAACRRRLDDVIRDVLVHVQRAAVSRALRCEGRHLLTAPGFNAWRTKHTVRREESSERAAAFVEPVERVRRLRDELLDGDVIVGGE